MEDWHFQSLHHSLIAVVEFRWCWCSLVGRSGTTEIFQVTYILIPPVVKTDIMKLQVNTNFVNLSHFTTFHLIREGIRSECFFSASLFKKSKKLKQKLNKVWTIPDFRYSKWGRFLSLYLPPSVIDNTFAEWNLLEFDLSSHGQCVICDVYTDRERMEYILM